MTCTTRSRNESWLTIWRLGFFCLTGKSFRQWEVPEFLDPGFYILWVLATYMANASPPTASLSDQQVAAIRRDIRCEFVSFRAPAANSKQDTQITKEQKGAPPIHICSTGELFSYKTGTINLPTCVCVPSPS